MAAVYDEHAEYEEVGNAHQQMGGKFTPPKRVTEPEKFSGVSIKQIPKETDHGDLMEFLVRAGLPDHLKESVEIKGNGSVSIKNIENQVCIKLINNIHNQTSFGKKLFCNGFIALTPEKDTGSVDTQVQAAAVSTASSLATSSTPTPPACSPSPTRSPAQPECSVSVPKVLVPQSPFTELPVSPFLRRYSCSMLDSPCNGSIAADILNTKKNLLSEIRDLQDQLSEFDSCRSEQSDSSGDESENKMVKQSKRKAGKTPIKSDEKSKKANLDWFEKPHDGSTH